MRSSTLFSDELEEVHLLRLSSAMSAIHGLQIGLQIPTG
jgi:hypothetical protein